MELYIRLQNGQPFEHPIFGDNFRQAFPDVDIDNLPDWAAKFERIAPPTPGIYEICESSYGWDGEVVKDMHVLRAMTDKEKTAKQDQVKAQWAQTGFASWVFNEATCSFNPLVPYPNDGKRYRWNEVNLTWDEHVVA